VFRRVLPSLQTAKALEDVPGTKKTITFTSGVTVNGVRVPDGEYQVKLNDKPADYLGGLFDFHPHVPVKAHGVKQVTTQIPQPHCPPGTLGSATTLNGAVLLELPSV
jgi:hypothetical protein